MILGDTDSVKEAIENHVVYGSKMGFCSRFISFTSELQIALSFGMLLFLILCDFFIYVGGWLLRIIYAKGTAFKECDVIKLDKNYLRDTLMSDKMARARSKRSDEVLVKSVVQIKDYKVLKITCGSCKQILNPMNPDDVNLFPSCEEMKDVINNGALKSEALSGANKRLFRIKIGSSCWVAHPPRPNYSLDNPVLYGTELVSMAFHEFMCCCMYRVLCPDNTPKSVLYTFDLHYEAEEIGNRDSFNWAFILMEDFHFIDEHRLLSETNTYDNIVKEMNIKFYASDLLLCNWDCINGRLTADSALYGFSRDEKTVFRVRCDRALGCTYPEDLEKEEEKTFFPFICDVSEMNNWLKKTFAINNGCSIQQFMYLFDKRNTEDLEVIANFFSEFIQYKGEPSNGWPPFDCTEFQKINNEDSVLKRLKERVESIKQLLPFVRIKHLDNCAHPCPRDGHDVVAAEAGGRKIMCLLGGNDGKTPLSDVWLYYRDTNKWEEICEFPHGGMYSFTATLLHDRYIFVFGGQRKGGFSNDTLLFDIQRRKWIDISISTSLPEKRCRHAAIALSKSKIIVVGGYGNKGKLSSVWEADIQIAGDNEMVCEVSWLQIKGLKKGIHRHFVFQGKAKCDIYILAGFGQSLMKIRTLPLSGEERSITTFGCPLKNQSMGGLSAVHDPIDNCVYVFGGDSAEQRNDGDRTFGTSGKTGYSCSVRVLKITKDSRGNNEFTWSSVKEYDMLEEKYRLQGFVSRSLCFFRDNRILLFGGRKQDDFTDELIEFRIHRKLEEDKTELLESMKRINSIIQNSDNQTELRDYLKELLHDFSILE
jgi:hypothetical protein